MSHIRDGVQDDRIDAALQEQRLADGATTDVLAAHAQQLAALRAEVTRQRTQIAVLTQLLMERGVVDGALLGARFEQAMGQVAAQASLATCGRCRKQVDRRATQVTAQGLMCDACARAHDVR